MNVDDSKASRFPGTVTEYVVFHRDASSHDPNGWKLLGKPTTEHDTLRDMVMPQIQIDSELYGKGWVDQFTNTEYKIMQRTVVRSEWTTEARSRKTD